MEEKIRWKCREKVIWRKKRKKVPLIERFEKYYIPEPNSGCWLWFGPGWHKFGYGMLTVDKKPEAAHRISWRIVNGPIPKGKFICHKCHNPPCVNPDHLYLGTPADNVRDREDRKSKPRWG